MNKVFLKISQNSQENTCAGVSLLIKLQTLAQVFSSEFCIFLKAFFFSEHLWTTASVLFTNFSVAAAMLPILAKLNVI